MAATIEQISEFLKDDGLDFKIDGNIIRTWFKTHNYRDANGNTSLGLIIRLEENGEFLKIMAPAVYKYSAGPYKAALFQVLLMVSWDTKMIQYEYDVSVGEVRANIEFPLEDSSLTQKQLMRCLHSIAGIVDENHGKVVAVIERGELPEADDGDMGELWLEFQEFLEHKKRAAGGADDGHGLPG